MLTRLLTATVDPRPLAATRVVVGAAAMVMAFDARRLIQATTPRTRLHLPVADVLPDPSYRIAGIVWLLLLGAATLLLVGVVARIAAASCAVLVVVPMALDRSAYTNHAVLLFALGLILALARPAEAWSLAAWRRARPPAAVPYWPILLLKTQITSLYAYAALAKLNHEYFTEHTLRQAAVGWLDDLPDALFTAAAGVVLVTEAALAVALWYRRTRTAAFVAGALLHLGLVLFGWSPIGLIPFAMLNVAPYPLFTQDPLWGQGGGPGALLASRTIALRRSC